MGKQINNNDELITYDLPGDLESYFRYLKAHNIHYLPKTEAARDFLAGRPRKEMKIKSFDRTDSVIKEPPKNPTAKYYETLWKPPVDLMMLDEIKGHLGECRRCKLAPERNKLVFGVGNPDAELVFVGEAPGADEDRQGEPFVGRAGKLLDKMILAMGKTRDDIYICNVLKCRPPDNRDPEADEVLACEPFLIKQIESIEPKVICALGSHAAKTLLKTNESIGKLRGKFHYYHEVKLLPTYHPAYLLRNASMKKESWADLQMVMRELNWPLPK